MRPSLVFTLPVLLACSAVLAFTPPGDQDEWTTGAIEVVLDSAPFHLVDVPGGQQLVMEGFDYLKEPGRPLLPEIQALVLLPPGARAVSLEIEEIGAEVLPGKYAIVPSSSLLPLSGALKKEKERLEAARVAAYADDGAYPPEAARITGHGSLRKFSYARISFRPFSYHAASGRLDHRNGVRLRVIYSAPAKGSIREQTARELLADTVADNRAAGLFVNYGEMKDQYEPEAAAPGADFAVHDFVVITTSGLAEAVAASDFVSWKTSLGYNVRTVLTTDAEVSGQSGVDLAARIRNFLRAYYGAWSIENVLLVGNYLDVPMRYCFPDPYNHLHNPADPGTGPGSVPTDAYYADLSFADADSWDLDGDGFYGEYGQDMPDFLAEVNVGRVPTSIASQVTYSLNKMVRYEQDTGDWKRSALHAGAVLFYENQDYSGIPFRDGAVCVDEIEQNFMQGWTMSRYSEQEGLVASVCPWPQISLTAFITDWRNGAYGIVNWSGHGWPDSVARTVWSADDGDGVPETDGSDSFWSDPFISDYPIFDDDYQSIVCAVSCNVGYPEPNAYGNLGIHLLSDPGAGAAAGIVSSSRYAAVTSDWPAQPGGAESLCYEFNRYLIAAPGGLRTLGAALYESKFYSHINYGWEMNYEYRNLYNYNLYGDPSMDWRGAGVRTGNLLRNTEVGQLDPVTPPLGGILPMDPVDDQYAVGFVSGAVDSDPAAGSALVFYSVDAPVWIYLTRTPSGDIRIDF